MLKVHPSRSIPFLSLRFCAPLENTHVKFELAKKTISKTPRWQFCAESSLLYSSRPFLFKRPDQSPTSVYRENSSVDQRAQKTTKKRRQEQEDSASEQRFCAGRQEEERYCGEDSSEETRGVEMGAINKERFGGSLCGAGNEDSQMADGVCSRRWICRLADSNGDANELESTFFFGGGGFVFSATASVGGWSTSNCIRS